MADQARSDPKWHAPAASTVSTLLSEILTPDLYRRNPFRILGLPITASTRAIATHVQKRLVLAELGSTDPSLDGPFPLKPAPTSEDIRKAERELHDPTRRILHELFWFWPLDGVDGANDPGFLALKAGDVPAASRIWSDAAANPSAAPIARHNNAVRWHLTALGLEKQSHKLKDDPQAQERYLRYWKGAIGLWDEVLGNDVTWSALSARALTLDDDRISLDFIQELRARSAEYFVAINSALVGRYVSDGRTDLPKIQVSLITSGKLKSFSSITFARATVALLKGNLRAFLRANDPGIEGKEVTGADIASKLIGVLGAYCACFEELESEAEDDSWRDTVDELISRANQYAVAYVTKTQDNARFAALLRSAIAFVSATDLFKRLDENKQSAIGNIAATYLEPYYLVLNKVLESKDPPKKRLDIISDKVISKLAEIRQRLSEIGHPIDEFTNSIAVVLRSVSVDAWNQKKDANVATKALDLADQLVVDKELADRLKTDRTALQELAAASEKERKDRLGRRAWGWAAAISVLLIIIYLGNNQQGGNTESATPGSGSISPSPATPQSSRNSTEGGHQTLDGAASSSTTDVGPTETYTVPHTYDAELNSDRQEVETAQAASRELDEQVEAAQGLLETKQAAAERLKTQADALSDYIEAQRPIVQNEDEAAVDAFNGQVSKYNQMIIRLRRLNANANSQVQLYNDLVEKAHAQTEASNRLVDAYNAKLARYGTKR